MEPGKPGRGVERPRRRKYQRTLPCRSRYSLTYFSLIRVMAALPRRPRCSALNDFPSEAYRRLGLEIGCPTLFDHRSAPGAASCHRPPSRRTFPLTPRCTSPTRLETGRDVELDGSRRVSASLQIIQVGIRPGRNGRCAATILSRAAKEIWGIQIPGRVGG